MDKTTDKKEGTGLPGMKKAGPRGIIGLKII
jgi:hypothetical protein